jgi:hypothetical protein
MMVLIFGRDQPFDIRYLDIDLVQTSKHIRKRAARDDFDFLAQPI